MANNVVENGSCFAYFVCHQNTWSTFTVYLSELDAQIAEKCFPFDGWTTFIGISTTNEVISRVTNSAGKGYISGLESMDFVFLDLTVYKSTH